MPDRAAGAPTDADSFVAWFEALEQDGPGQNDPLFPWLAETASMDQMRWFLTQEVAGEAGFEVVPGMPKSTVQCLAPMTYVVVFTAPNA